MNDRFDPNDESSDFHPVDGDGQVSRFEQQLRSVQPRVPQLNWDKITSGLTLTATPVASSTSQRGFSVRQMTLAVAASWLIGVVVGGSCILWSRPVPVPALVSAPVIVEAKAEVSSATEQHLPVAQPGRRSATAVVNSQDSSIEGEPSFTKEKLPRVEFSSLVWQSDEPLSPRSLTSHKSARPLTTLRTSGSTVPANIASHASEAAASRSFNPAPMSNRQQLMEQYLQETDRQVY